MYSEIIVGEITTRYYFLGAAQKVVSDLKRDGIDFKWYFGGKLQIP